ncbi:MAG: helix-turn-helix domain-containing protein [Actinomycetota bacterium]|nr:helix-turn-helix domain-containing protein [Actinomycetota bacterium]
MDTHTSTTTTPDGDKRWLTLRQAAERVGVSQRTVSRWVAEDSLPVVRLGKVVRIDPGAMDRWLAEHTVTFGAAAPRRRSPAQKRRAEPNGA